MRATTAAVCVALHDVVQRAALVRLAEHVGLHEGAVGVQRHARVEQQVAVVDLVQAARVQEEAIPQHTCPF